MSNAIKEPPLGILPHGLWWNVVVSERVKALKNTISRYIEAGEQPNPEWEQEVKLWEELEVKQIKPNNKCEGAAP